MKRKKLDLFSITIKFLVWGSAIITMGALLFIIFYITCKGLPHLSLDLFSLKYTSENVSMVPAIINTTVITFLALALAVPLGIGTAIYLVEYAKKGNKFVQCIRITTETLSGIPSVLYGLFGMILFVFQLKMGYSLLAGSLTIAIMILPLIIRTTEETFMAIPDSYREGSFALGAGRVRTIFSVILPSAIPGILTGIILSIGRIVGETAALIYTAGTVADIAKTPLNSGRTLAVHMYTLSREGLHTHKAFATAFILLLIVFIINLCTEKIAKSTQIKNHE